MRQQQGFPTESEGENRVSFGEASKLKKKNNSRNVTILNQALRVIQQEAPNKQKESAGDSIQSPRQKVLNFRRLCRSVGTVTESHN